MEWKECAGIGQPAMKSQEDGGTAMCPICTRYLNVRIGAPTPYHLAVVIVSAPLAYPPLIREIRL